MAFKRMTLSILAGLLLMASGLLAAGHSVTLTWTASVDMPATIPAGSGYSVFRIAGACPASVTSTTGWTLVNSAPVAANTFVDSTVTAGSFCYVVETVLSGSTSVPSNSAHAALTVAPPTNVIITNQQ